MGTNCLFDKQKLETLQTADLSRKGSFDQLIDDFLRHLNTHNDYFTLSSCSGRIVLLKSQKVSKYNKQVKVIAIPCPPVPVQTQLHFILSTIEHKAYQQKERMQVVDLHPRRNKLCRNLEKLKRRTT